MGRSATQSAHTKKHDLANSYHSKKCRVLVLPLAHNVQEVNQSMR